MTSIDTDQPLSRHSLTAIRQERASPRDSVTIASPKTNRARSAQARWYRSRRESGQPTDFGQVFLIQSAAAVDSLCPLPGFGQFPGAVMLRIGMVMTRSASQVMNGYSGLFLLKPVIASL